MLSQARGLAEAVGLPVEAKTVHPRLPWTLLPVTSMAYAVRGPGPRQRPPDAALAPFGDRLRLAFHPLHPGDQTRLARPHVYRSTATPAHRPKALRPRRPAGTRRTQRPERHSNCRQSKRRHARETRRRREAMGGAIFDNFPSRASQRSSAAPANPIASPTTTRANLQPNSKRSQRKASASWRRHRAAPAKRKRESSATRSTGTNAYVWNGQGENPYFGLLALADAILVTCESTNMAIEAAATGKPVYIVDIPGGDPKFDRLHASLKARGITRPFAGKSSIGPMNR